MTNEDAKAILLEIKNGALWKLNIQIAFDMAIKALKERPIEEKNLIVDRDIPSLMLHKGEGKVFYDNARHQIIVPACYINLEVVNELKELKLKEVEE